MSNLSRRILMVAASAGAALALASCNQAGGGGAASADAKTMGDAKAPIHVEEYASLTCGACGQFATQVFPAFKAKYVDTGKVRYTLHEFLTEPMAVAAAGFLTARCAGDDKYFGVVDALFHAQEEMYRSGDARGTLLKVAQSAGLTEAQFTACIQDEAAAEALNARVERAARQENIRSTPTFVVNGKVVKEGVMSLEELDAAIAAASK